MERNTRNNLDAWKDDGESSSSHPPSIWRRSGSVLSSGSYFFGWMGQKTWNYSKAVTPVMLNKSASCVSQTSYMFGWICQEYSKIATPIYLIRDSSLVVLSCSSYLFNWPSRNNYMDVAKQVTDTTYAVSSLNMQKWYCPSNGWNYPELLQGIARFGFIVSQFGYGISEFTLQCCHVLNIGSFVWKLFKTENDGTLSTKGCSPEVLGEFGHVAMQYGVPENASHYFNYLSILTHLWNLKLVWSRQNEYSSEMKGSY